MMILNYEHDYRMKCIAKFLLLTPDKQRHSDWSGTATTGLHGEKMLNNTSGTAPNVNERRIPEISKTPGSLNPLPIPARPWQHISMDFRSFNKDRKGYDAAFVVVD